MPARLEEYALIGDLHTAALVSRHGSVDWMCVPRFDSGAVFASLLGSDANGHWRIAPSGPGTAVRRGYRDDTLVLDTEWETPTGTVQVTDFMPPRDGVPNLVRTVRGVSGEVAMHSLLRLRFDYGRIVPWVEHVDGQLVAIAGPDAIWLHGDVPHAGRDFASHADFTVRPGQEVSFVMTWHPSFEEHPTPVPAGPALESTLRFWREWSTGTVCDSPWRDAVVRSLITLKALIYEPTGGIVAAPTTSLPEEVGGVRNWDYRYCWLRDATLTLQALVRSGHLQEAADWRGWLLRAIAGDPADLQIMYGLAGERRLTEFELEWLPGYERSAPVRIGNAASGQLQLDVYGEVVSTLDRAQAEGMEQDPSVLHIVDALLGWLQTGWRQPDEGLWEVRGPRRHFTHSKMLAWAAFDSGARIAERAGHHPTAARWRAVRDEIHADVCARAYDPVRNTFTQSYGSPELDAAVLLMPQLGFLPGDDPRVIGTVDAIAAGLTQDGFVRRYDPGVGGVDGLPGSEGAFLACSFWMVDALALTGRLERAEELFERLLALANDVGLLSEEYDPTHRRQVGNFPQAFTHVGLVNSARRLAAGRAAGQPG